jgi:uncharacterized protein (DUF433 family)
MSIDLAQLDDDELEIIRQSLRGPRGRYYSDRAAQLAGVPLRTLNHWTREGHLTSDYELRPKSWSYRDLVLIRLFVWLRSHHHAPIDAAVRVSSVRNELNRPDSELSIVRSHGGVLLIGDEHFDRESGIGVFPDLLTFIADFSLLQSIDVPELGKSRVWGPNLVRPSPNTEISPWIMAGDPCVRGSRLPTASLFVLSRDREMSQDEIAELYNGVVSAETVGEAISLELRLRRLPAAA